jgi:beta-fructofuranosidase
MHATSHPYIWDSWYWYDTDADLFHVYYLNVDDHDLVPKEEHHFSARIGYATTTNFVEYDYHHHAVMTATGAEDSRDNTSIWTGCSVAYGKEGRRLMAFTSRDEAQAPVEGLARPFTQHISFATSPDGLHWQRLKDVHLDPDPRYYSTRSIVGDVVIHAWRDPVIFRAPESDYAYMLVCAHGKDLPHGVKGEKNGAHGVVALLKSTRPKDLSAWEATGISFAVDVPEAEVPRMYIDRTTGKHMIAYSCKNAEAYVPHTPDKSKVEYGFYGFYVDLKALAQEIESGAVTSPRLIHVEERERIPLLAYGEDALYACQVVPELGGQIIGFDTNQGIIRASTVRLADTLAPADMDFRDFNVTGA